MANLNKMIEIKKEKYTLLLSDNPCQIFWHLGVREAHGLSYKECMLHKNNDTNAYIAGWCNYYPKESGNYTKDDPIFVFINLTRCTSELETILTLNHEFTHAALKIFDWDLQYEEDIITWSEVETRAVYSFLKNEKLVSFKRTNSYAGNKET
jgi:hypothetical protein